MIKKSFNKKKSEMQFVIFQVLLLMHHHVTSAEFNLNSLNATTKSSDTFNQNEITLNNTWDYGDDDPIIRQHTAVTAKAAKEIGRLLLNTTTTTIRRRQKIRKGGGVQMTIRSLGKYSTNEKSLKAQHTVGQPKGEATNNQHRHYRNSNHFYDYLTTIKFNKRNKANNYDNFTANNNNNNNKLKTTTATPSARSEGKESATNAFDGKESWAELQLRNIVEQKEEKEKDQKMDKQKSNNKEDSYQVKYQTKYYAAPANTVGQMPQFQLQLYLHYLYQQAPTTTTTTTATTSSSITSASLLPHEYHHLADYRLLFNAERHTQFYLHTLTTTQNDFVTVATKQHKTTTATTTATEATEATTFESFQQPDAHNRYEYQDDDYNYNYNDKTSNNEYQNHDYDTDAAVAVADDNDAADGWHANNEMHLLNATTNARLLNILTDTIGAAFGVNTRPVAAIQEIQTEEIELFNGLSLRQSRFNPFNPCRILIHGWLGSSNAGIYNTLVPEYLKLQNGIFNVFNVDWGRGAMTDYITASYRVKPVAKVVAQFIDFLHQESGISFENIQVVGFSMGAHVAGIAGKHVTQGRLPVIYGLDPALPLFRFASAAERLDITDANYIEVLHTSVGSYGYDHPLGHVDFYINFGYNQPGCFFNECSHFRAFQIFAQTLRNEKLQGEECSSALWWDMIQHKRCQKRVGRSLTVGVEGLTGRDLGHRRGIYYVLTNAQAPFKIK